MLLVVLEVALVNLIFHLGQKSTEAVFHTGDPLAIIVISHIPDVLALTMSLIHDKFSFIVAILQEHAAIPMMVSLRPIAFIEVATLN